MRIENRTVSAAWKAAACLAGLAGILIQCGALDGDWDLLVLRYYTLVSNVLCTVYFGIAAAFTAAGKATPLPKCKGALLMGITVTGLVYHLLLSDGTFRMSDTMAVADTLLHTVTPILCVTDWLLFDEKGTYTPMSPLSWVILPDAYFVLATAYGFCGGKPFYGDGRFPYFFMDYDTLGVWRVLAYVAALNAAFCALGYGYYFLDRLLRRRTGPDGEGAATNAAGSAGQGSGRAL